MKCFTFNALNTSISKFFQTPNYSLPLLPLQPMGSPNVSLYKANLEVKTFQQFSDTIFTSQVYLIRSPLALFRGMENGGCILQVTRNKILHAF